MVEKKWMKLKSVGKIHTDLMWFLLLSLWMFEPRTQSKVLCKRTRYCVKRRKKWVKSCVSSHSSYRTDWCSVRKTSEVITWNWRAQNSRWLLLLPDYTDQHYGRISYDEMIWSESVNYSAKWNYFRNKWEESKPTSTSNVCVCVEWLFSVQLNQISFNLERKNRIFAAPFAISNYTLKKWNQIDSWKTKSDKCVFSANKYTCVECSTTWIYMAHGIRGRIYFFSLNSLVRLSVKSSKLQKQNAPAPHKGCVNTHSNDCFFPKVLLKWWN